MMALGTHAVRQESDEYVCYNCRKRWDTRDEPPPCMDDKEYNEAKVEEAQRYERVSTMPPPRPAPQRWPADKLLLFRMIRSSEQHHPRIHEHLKGKVAKQYFQWKQEQMYGSA